MNNWWGKDKIPMENKKFQKIFEGFVFECPASIEKKIMDQKFIVLLVLEVILFVKEKLKKIYYVH